MEQLNEQDLLFIYQVLDEITVKGKDSHHLSALIQKVGRIIEQTRAMAVSDNSREREKVPA